MSHIQALGWIDTGLMWANFRLRYMDLARGEPAAYLPLMAGGRPEAVMEKFGSAKAALARLASAAAPFLGGRPALLLDVAIEVLLPNSHTEWSQEDDVDQLQFQLALTNPPGAWLYVGGEAVQLGVGVLNYVNVAALNCAVNFSDHARVHLVARVKRPETEEL